MARVIGVICKSRLGASSAKAVALPFGSVMPTRLLLEST
jgi:hypothetical protein